MRTILVTGERGAGKSTLLRHLVAAGRIHNNITNLPPYFGVVTSTERSQSGHTRTIKAEILPDGITGVLASTEHHLVTPPTGPRIGPFLFSQSLCDQANRVLVEGAGQTAVIDEIGPLELTRQAGFRRGLLAVLQSQHSAVIVVRPDLVAALTDLAARYRPANSVVVFQIESPEQAEQLAPRIRAELVRGDAAGN